MGFVLCSLFILRQAGKALAPAGEIRLKHYHDGQEVVN
jgi:hypothetical protein